MSKDRRRLIPAQFRASPPFLEDLKSFAASPIDVLLGIAKASESPTVVPTDDRLEELSSRSSMEPEQLLRIAAVLVFLRQRTLDTEAEPAEVVEELVSLVEKEGGAVAAGRAELRNLFALPPEVREEALAVRAFDFSATYLSAEVRPVFMPLSNQDDRVLPGFLLSLNYIDSDREKNSVTLAITQGEVAQLKNQLDIASRQMSRLRAKICQELTNDS